MTNTTPVPSQIDGKASYDDDFKAGFAAGVEALADSPRADACTAKRAYREVSRAHGSWWVDGFCAAIDDARGAYAMRNVRIARALGL